MTVLEWSDALSLDLPLMDNTHREFVDLLAAAAQADDRDLLPAWAALVEHTQVSLSVQDDERLGLPVRSEAEDARSLLLAGPAGEARVVVSG